jgi:hypothetical protein
MSKADLVNSHIQRGLMRCTLDGLGNIAITPTNEGEIAAKVLARGGHMRCLKCDQPHPVAGVLPKYSYCPDCRKGTMPTVDFIERPS